MPGQDKVIEWLLEPDNPPVRYLALTRLLGKAEADAEVRRARANLMDYDVTRKILSRYSDFRDDRDERAYWKYSGKYWQLIFLGQFLADGNDPRVAELAEGILNRRTWVNAAGGQCLTAYILAALTRLGHGDNVVRQETEALAGRIVASGGIDCSVMDYSLLSRCYMAQPKLLLCFTQVASKNRSPRLRAAIDLLVNSLVEREVYVYVPGNRKGWAKALEGQPKRADLPTGQTVKQSISIQRETFIAEHGLGERAPKAGWLKFGFPLHYNSDVLEAMYSLALADVPFTPRLEKPLRTIREKQTPDGKWLLENSLNGKMLADVEKKGKPSKWLTFFARYVLRHFTG